MSDADPQPIAPEPEILLCDDVPSNLRILGRLLRSDGYRVRVATSGEAAVRAVARRVPDLVLMDVLMPELDGFETSRRIHSIEGAAAVPIIFISGLDTPRSKVEAFTSGGVDYITKPFEPAEVRARVANHLRLRGLQRRLEGRNRDLEEANKRLESLQRMQESLTNLVVHDLRSPLTGVVTALELLDEDLPTNAEMQREELNLARTAAASMTDLVNDLLGVSKLEAAEMPLQFDVHPFPAIWADVVDALGGLAADQRVVFDGEGPLAVECDAGLMRRVLINLIHNGLKYSPEEAPVVVRARSAGGRLRVEVSDAGPGIEEKYWGRIFEKFGQVDVRQGSRRSSTGLGLTFCKLAVEAHGGRIGLTSEVGVGTTFWFSLPLRQVEARPTLPAPPTIGARIAPR